MTSHLKTVLKRKMDKLKETLVLFLCVVTFVKPGQVEGAWDVDHKSSRGIWPAGISVKCPVTVQAH